MTLLDNETVGGVITGLLYFERAHRFSVSVGGFI
jgi:hypothetical protein